MIQPPRWLAPKLPSNEPLLPQATLDLPPPPSVNRIRRLNKSEMHFHSYWIDKCDQMVTAQWAAAKLRGASRPSFGDAKVSILIQLNEKMRLRDADNASKAILDYLKRIQIIRDDSKQYVRRITLEWVEPKAAPEGVRLTVVRL
jgi:Holliday junction resolvase RusA-like endonuclease